MKEKLLNNLNKVHTTELGQLRIKKNLGINCDAVDFCKSKICNPNCNVRLLGKNFYCEIGEIVITINSNSFTIITAHIKKI